MVDLVDYAKNVADKMLAKKHTDEEINIILQRIDKIRNDIDISMKRNRGWRYIRDNFLPELNPKNTYFTKFDNRNILCVDNNDGTYNVCFSFVNPKEAIIDNDYKKYVLYNYYKGKYLYKNIKATSYLNAITIANNQNFTTFPVCDFYKYKMSTDISIQNIDPYELLESDCNTIQTKNLRENYKRSLEVFLEKYQLKNGDYRFYSFMDRMSVLVVREDVNSFTVSFAFISPKDARSYFALNDYYKKISGRYATLQNYLSGKNTFSVHDARNSMTSIVRAFNDNKNKFPRQYKNSIMSLVLSI